MFEDVRDADLGNVEPRTGATGGAILAFPPRRGPAPAANPNRLSVALSTLQRALAEQEHALAEWRESLGDLGAALSGLHGSLVRYRGALEGVATGVETLRQEALNLGFANLEADTV